MPGIEETASSAGKTTASQLFFPIDVRRLWHKNMIRTEYRIKFHRHKSREKEGAEEKSENKGPAECSVASFIAADGPRVWWPYTKYTRNCYWLVNNTSGKKHVDSFLAG